MHKEELLAITNNRLRRLATYASISVALVLIGTKLFAYMATDSVAILSSLLDSTIDLLSSLVTAFGVASALRPPDREHRFGHGKAEPLAALAQAAFIIGSSVLLGYEALSRLFFPHGVQQQMIGYAVMAVAIVLSMALVLFQHHVVHKTHSIAIHADRLHYVGDLAINVAVMVSFGLYQWLHIDWIDPLFALVIAGALTGSAFHIMKHALHVLMDRELPDQDRGRIKAIVQAHPAVIGIHDMRTRSDSDRIFVEIHVEMDPDMNLREAHTVADAIVDAVQHAFPHADVLVHQDPAGLIEPRLDQDILVREIAAKRHG